MDLQSINLGINFIPFSALNAQTNFRINSDKTNYCNENNVVVKGVSWVALLDSGTFRSCVSKDFMDKCRIPIEKS